MHCLFCVHFSVKLTYFFAFLAGHLKYKNSSYFGRRWNNSSFIELILFFLGRLSLSSATVCRRSLFSVLYTHTHFILCTSEAISSLHLAVCFFCWPFLFVAILFELLLQLMLNGCCTALHFLSLLLHRSQMSKICGQFIWLHFILVLNIYSQ